MEIRGQTFSTVSRRQPLLLGPKNRLQKEKCLKIDQLQATILALFNDFLAYFCINGLVLMSTFQICLNYAKITFSEISKTPHLAT